MTIEVRGTCASRFEPVRNAFADNFRRYDEHGAAVAVWQDGGLVVDLWGGSRDRAASVVAALTGTHAIARDRLAPDGAGPLAPVASNADEPGRAKNRRVEMVLR